jgi:hypothetical protein
MTRDWGQLPMKWNRSSYPLVPAKAGTRCHIPKDSSKLLLDSRFRGNERVVVLFLGAATAWLGRATIHL